MGHDVNFLKEVMRKVTEKVGSKVSGESPGDIYFKEGTYVRDIDEEAYRISSSFLQNKIDEKGVLAFGGEAAVWRDVYDQSKVENIEDYNSVIIFDFVEGTKNTGKGASSDVYTTAVLFSPEEGPLASSIYRWDGEKFFYDGDVSWRNGRKVEARRVDKIEDTVKIRGIPILKYVGAYHTVADFFLEEFGLEEKDQPLLKCDGTTTGNLIGVALDKSIDMDPRALFEGSERTSFIYDLAPAGLWARNLGVEIYDFDGNKLHMNMLREGGIGYVALPPGRLRKNVKEKLPKLKKRLLDEK